MTLVLNVCLYLYNSIGCSESPPVTTKLSDDQIQNLEFRIKVDIDQIQKHFGTLQTIFRRSLKERGVPVRGIIAHVIGFGVAEADKEKLRAEESLDEVFIVLTDYWSFLDCDLLDSIVEIYGNDVDRSRMQKYKEELELFCKRRVSEVPSGELLLSKDQTRERIIVKLNINDPRLSIIKDLKIKMCKVLKIEPCVLQIMEVKEGCVQVTFLIPSHISKLLFIKSLTKVQYDHFKALSVLSLTCAHFQEVFLVREYWL